MGISSLGTGSGVLTQDVLDQLRAADDSQYVTPIELSITNEEDKISSLEVIDANMTNFADSVSELASPLLYDERTTSVVGTSVEVTADANTDIQDFTLDVQNLATKQIEQSGAFSADTELIASGTGSMNLNIDGQDFTIDYTDTTTLADLKNSINEVAGEKVDATIVQISSGEYRLFLSSSDTGSSQDITMTDNTGNLTDTRLTTDFDAAPVQEGVDANFTFNGQAITRSSNQVDDLITGLDITLKEVGSTEVSIEQDRAGILEKIDSFVEKYNSTMVELDKMTKPSVNSDERGIFSNDSSIKAMKNMVRDMAGSVGGGVGSLYDYGFDIDRDGNMTFDSSVFEAQLDDNPGNVEAFFSGGTYTNPDGTTTEVTGAFVEYKDAVEEYTSYTGTLNQLDTYYSDNISSLEDEKTKAIDRLDNKYEILAKQYAAYDAMINSYNQDSALFAELNSSDSSQ